MPEHEREVLQKLQSETLSEKHRRLTLEKQTICPHTNIDEQDGFRWCADCDYNFN